MKKRVSTILLALAMLISTSAISGCTKTGSKDALGSAIQVVDDFGRKVILESAPERIISLAPSNTEILFALGLGERVAAVTDFCDFPLEAKEKQKVGGFSEPNLERIVEISPDLILATSMHAKEIEKLDELGLKVFVIDSKSLKDIFSAIDKVGSLTLSKPQAKALIGKMSERLSEIDKRLAGLPAPEKPLVYYEIWNDPLMTVGKDGLIAEAIRRAGGMNLGDGLTGEYPELSLEKIIESDPKVIIAPKGSMSDPAIVKERAGWEEISAVQNDRVYIVDESLLVRFGPRIVDGIYYMAEMIHPERF